jgi:subtilisin family serine protease
MPVPKIQTLIAIIDTGFALEHEEFNGRLYQNPGESGTATTESASLLNCSDRSIAIDASCNLIDDNVDGIVDNESGATVYQNPSLKNCSDQGMPLTKYCNRIDDDNNGYIDDIRGWDFVNADPSAQAGQLNPAGTNLRHGTMVMGIAAASGNNALGTAGIDWNATLLPLQAIDDDGYGDSLTVGNAIIYAANQGADVINLSLGTANPDAYILNAIEYAYDKGSVVVAAAGNDGCDCMIYPARYAISLSVGATDEANNRAAFSSYGSNLDVVAPGVALTSTSYSIGNPTNSYSTGSGTSYATPVVSGLVSVLKGQLPTATPAQLIALITEKTSQNAVASLPYKTTDRGYGDISLQHATARALTPKIFTQIYKPGAMVNGGVFKGTPVKDNSYFCESAAAGTTPLYSATNTATMYSTNPIDVRLAGIYGYAVQQLFTTCMLQPHDIYQSARELHTAQEFTNTNIKTLLVP